jgi:hypothetical protein
VSLYVGSCRKILLTQFTLEFGTLVSRKLVALYVLNSGKVLPAELAKYDHPRWKKEQK